jgi:hypothetical protein
MQDIREVVVVPPSSEVHRKDGFSRLVKIEQRFILAKCDPIFPESHNYERDDEES